MLIDNLISTAQLKGFSQAAVIRYLFICWQLGWSDGSWVTVFFFSVSLQVWTRRGLLQLTLAAGGNPFCSAVAMQTLAVCRSASCINTAAFVAWQLATWRRVTHHLANLFPKSNRHQILNSGHLIIIFYSVIFHNIKKRYFRISSMYNIFWWLILIKWMWNEIKFTIQASFCPYALYPLKPLVAFLVNLEDSSNISEI